MPPQEWSLTARWIVPVDRPPAAHGVLAIRGDRIVSVSERGRADVDWGNVAVLPGFVNAHAHLDLCGMRGLGPPGDDFVTWLKGVIAYRPSRTPEQVKEDIETGIRQSIRYGSLLVGDISARGQSWDVLASAASRSVVFWELIGLGRDRARAAWKECDRWLRSRPTSLNCRPGLSPHAPYSVRAGLLRATARRARREALPLAIHLAETLDEIDLIGCRQGRLVDLLRGLDAWDESAPIDNLDSVYDWTRDNQALSYIHGNFLDHAERIPDEATVVHCPRSHTFFGRSIDSLTSLRRAKIGIALGTDSLGSAPDLSILAEARHLWQQASDIPPAQIIAMATIEGARALGWSDEAGSLTPGKSADFIAIPLAGESRGDPCLDLLETGAEVDTIVFRGKRQLGERPVPGG
jgi:cytosine/adenosine deaminase-related metal-dependent hydrolase